MINFFLQKKQFIFVLVLLWACTSIEAQQRSERCGTRSALDRRLAKDAAYAKFYKKATAIASYGSNKKVAIACNGTNTIRVPVAFHFDETFSCIDKDCILTKVNEQLEILNQGFGDNTGSLNANTCPQAYIDSSTGESVISTGTCIEFYMPQPPADTGLSSCDLPITINEFNGGYGADGWGAGVEWEGILNIFIINDQCLGVADGIPGYADGDGISVCGAAFGGVGESAPHCGIGLDNDAFADLGKTLIHEIGHYLGLEHIFEDGCAGTLEMNPLGPFDVLDTPAQADAYYGCPTSCVASGCGANSTPQQTANFMNYTDDSCMDLFTQDQAMVLNYWANELFGQSNFPDAASDAGIYTACGDSCNFDVSIQKTVNDSIVAINSDVVFTIKVTNHGASVTDAIVTDALPAGLSFDGTNYNASTGTFDGTTWTIGNMSPDAEETLDITLKATAEGVQTNFVTITINEAETDATNNKAAACVSVPVQICDDGSQSIEATGFDVNEDGTTTYQWYVSGDNGITYTAIDAADGGTEQNYTISQAGYYTYVVNDGELGNCSEQLCCPIIVEATVCEVCPPNLCIPIIVRKVE